MLAETQMIDQERRLTLLYTAALNGNLALLPRLFSRIRQERANAALSILVDLGQSCAPEAWICESTGGRGMLVAMDAMGYDAFHIGPRDMLYTQPALVEQLRGIVSTPFAAGPWTARVSRGDLSISLVNAVNLPNLLRGPTPNDVANADVVIGLRYSDAVQVEASYREPFRLLMLDCGTGTAASFQPVIERLDVLLTPTPPYILIDSRQSISNMDQMIPDPTMTGVIEFVQSEALYAERRRSQP